MKEQVTPAEYPEGYLLRAFTTCLILQLEISYVPTRSEQTANANLSMSQGLPPCKDKYSDYFLQFTLQKLIARHKDNDLPPEGKSSFIVILRRLYLHGVNPYPGDAENVGA